MWPTLCSAFSVLVRVLLCACCTRLCRIVEGNPELTEEAARVLAIRGTKQTSDGGERVSICTGCGMEVRTEWLSEQMEVGTEWAE